VGGIKLTFVRAVVTGRKLEALCFMCILPVGDNDASIIFKKHPGSKREQYTEVGYTVILGSHKNSRLSIDKNGSQAHAASAPIAVLEKDDFTRYWVDLNEGSITCGRGEPGTPPYYTYDPCTTLLVPPT
jgi:hypothetical protein